MLFCAEPVCVVAQAGITEIYVCIIIDICKLSLQLASDGGLNCNTNLIGELKLHEGSEREEILFIHLIKQRE